MSDVTPQELGITFGNALSNAVALAVGSGVDVTLDEIVDDAKQLTRLALTAKQDLAMEFEVEASDRPPTRKRSSSSSSKGSSRNGPRTPSPKQKKYARDLLRDNDEDPDDYDMEDYAVVQQVIEDYRGF